jgi:outer membrane protein assembly factor BamB
MPSLTFRTDDKVQIAMMFHPLVRRSCLATLVALTALTVPAAAEDLPPVVLPGESRATSLRLAEARKSIAQPKWADALEDLQAVLDAGNDLAALDNRRSLQARWAAHAALASLPADTLAIYRRRVDGQAARWLAQALREDDERLLRRVVEEAFCSRAAEKALDWLGDRAFERGQFDEAAAWWRLLASPDKDASDLVYPDLRLDPARILAKQLLARLFRDGPGAAWQSDLRAYCKAHGAAEGTLAGRRGHYADILEALAGDRGKEPLPDPDWFGYGGNDAHGLVVRTAEDALDPLTELLRDGPTWRFSLPNRNADAAEAGGKEKIQALSTLSRSLAFYPVLTANHILVADAHGVTAYDLRTGRPASWYHLVAAEAAGLNLQAPAPPDLRYTVTLADGNAYVRLGAQGLRPPPMPGADLRPVRKTNAEESFLACLRATPGGGDSRLRWRVRPGREGEVFEGSPVVDRGLVFIAATRFVEQRILTSIACYADQVSEASLRWRRDICETRTILGGRGEAEPARYRHPVLTRAGSLLVYCSDSGAIVAVEAFTGRTVWGVRYPREAEDNDEDTLEIAPSMRPGGGWRDLNPCLYADGRLYAAPADSNRLLCLDPATGKMLWERERLKVVHLLGVGHGKLIFTTTNGLRAVGAADGGDATGWALPSAGRLPPMGRGLLLGDWVLWPTAVLCSGLPPRFVVYAVHQEDGRLADPAQLHRLPAGNLAYAHGCLAVADAETLTVFVPPRLRLVDKERQAKEIPPGPITRQGVRTLLELARAQTDAGQPATALETLRRVMTASPTVSNGGKRWHDEVDRCRQKALLRAAKAAMDKGRQEEAETLLSAAARPEEAPALRCEALARAAEMWEEVGQPDKALAAWKTILGNPELRAVQGVDAMGLPRRGAEAAKMAVGRLCRADEKRSKGEEEQARALWEKALPSEKETAAERLAVEFPHTQVTCTALAERARELEKTNPSAAAHAWRRVLTVGASDNEKAAARAGLARCWELQGCPKQSLTGSQADAPLRRVWHSGLGAKETILSGPEAASGLLFLAGPGMLARRASEGGGQNPRMLTASEGGQNPRLRVGLTASESQHPRLRVGLTASESQHPRLRVGLTWAEIVAMAVASGHIVWHSAVAFTPTWAAFYENLVIAAGAEGIMCCRCEDGVQVWDFPVPRAESLPFSPARTLHPILDPRPAEALHGFQLCGGRLFFFQGLRRLFALEVNTGRLLWARYALGAQLQLPPPRGLFVPAFFAGPRTLFVQSTSGLAWLLDAANGRVIQESSWPGLWHSPPLPLEEHLLCAASGTKVAAVDCETGREAWSHPISGKTILSGEPAQILSAGSSVLVATPTNLGCRLEHLSAATGRPLWKQPLRLRLDRVDTSAWAADGESLFIARPGENGAILECRSLADGLIRWERPLPGAAVWMVRRVRNGLVCHPTAARIVQFRFPWPGGALQWEQDQALPSGGAFRVVWCDPATGATVQVLNFDTTPRLIRARGTGGVFTSGLHWSAEGAPLRAFSQGWVVALGSDTWGLAAD